MKIDVRFRAIVEKARRLTNWVGVWMNEPSTTADGKRVAFLQSSGRGTGYVADLEAGGTRLVSSRRFTLEEGGDDAILDWMADGKTLIVAANRGDHYVLYLQSMIGDTQATTVTSGRRGLLELAQVSPDGKWIIIQVWPVGGKPNDTQVMRVPIKGGVPESIFAVREGSSNSCARFSNLCAIAEQSEDGKQMILTAFDPVKGRGLEVARFDLDPDYDTSANNLLWNISPDGARIAAARGPEGPIQIRSLRGQPTQVIRPKGLKNMRELQWAADGKGLFVSQRIVGGSEILHLDLQGNAKPLWKCNGDRCFGLPSPDGRHIAIDEWKQNTNFWTMENF